MTLAAIAYVLKGSVCFKNTIDLYCSLFLKISILGGPKLFGILTLLANSMKYFLTIIQLIGFMSVDVEWTMPNPFVFE